MLYARWASRDDGEGEARGVILRDGVGEQGRTISNKELPPLDRNCGKG
jgi:hypothetical protein